MSVKARYSYQLVKKIIQRFLKDPEKNISKEVQFMRMALSDFPDPEFWLQFDLGFKIHSVIYFRKKDVKLNIKTQYNVWKSKQQKEVGEFVDRFFKKDCDEAPAVPKKPRNNKDFLT